MGLFSRLFGKQKTIDNIATTNEDDTFDLTDELSHIIKQYINTKDDAYSVSWCILNETNTMYFNNSHAKGDGKFPNQENSPILIKKYLSKVLNEDQSLKEEYLSLSPHLNYKEIGSVFNSLTRSIGGINIEAQLDVNYSIIENIIKEWDLAQ